MSHSFTSNNSDIAKLQTLEKSSDTLFRNSDLPEQHLPASNVREAAVLIPLIRENANWSVLFIRRTESERDRHSGQVAFPGGRRDAIDASLTHTALREFNEEIGIATDGIKLLGNLSEYVTTSYYRIAPVVGVVPWPSKITMQPDEVARVFSIPLDWLNDHSNLQIKARKIRDVSRHPVIYYDRYDGELLWGATARMTVNLCQAIDTGAIQLPHIDP